MRTQQEWVTVVECSYSDLETVTPTISSLDKDTVFHIRVQTQWWAPIAPLFDLMGAEWVADRLWDVGGELQDVWGEGLHTVVMECKSDPVHVVGLLIALGVILARVAAAIAIISIIALIWKIVEPILDAAPLIMMVVIMGMITILPRLLPKGD